MAWNGAGNFQRTNGSFSGQTVWEDDANAGFDIVDARHDTHDQDLAQGINNYLTKDGQNSPTANLSMNTYKHLNVGDGSARNQYATVGQLQDEGVRAVGSVGGTANAITASMTPTISAYVTGAQYTFKAIATNSGATTLKIDSAPALAIQRNVAALVGGEIVNGRYYTVVYDGTVFQLLNTTANPLFLDSVNNRVGIGTTAPADALEVATTGFFPQYWSGYPGASAGGANLIVRRSRGATVGANTILANNDIVGAIGFQGANGTTFTQCASIGATIDGVPGASNDMPGRLTFETTPDGSGTPLERMRIAATGRIAVGTTSTTPAKFVIRGEDAIGTNWSLWVEDSAGAQILGTLNSGLIQTGTKTQSPYNLTTGSAANVVVDNSGSLLRSTSSLRYKSNVVTATHGLAEVLQLRSVTFNATNSGDTTFGGLIAEEVHNIGLHEFVVYNADNQPDALHYGNMVALAFKAIQELNAKVEALEARVAALEP